MPIILRDISWIASVIGASSTTRGTRLPVRIRSRTFAKRIPIEPPGCSSAKSRSPNPRRSESDSARASPSASIAVVDAVGARLRGQASRGMAAEIAICAALAAGESALR